MGGGSSAWCGAVSGMFLVSVNLMSSHLPPTRTSCFGQADDTPELPTWSPPASVLLHPPRLCSQGSPPPQTCFANRNQPARCPQPNCHLCGFSHPRALPPALITPGPGLGPLRSSPVAQASACSPCLAHTNGSCLPFPPPRVPRAPTPRHGVYLLS